MAVEETLDGFTLRMQGQAPDIPPSTTQLRGKRTTTKHRQRHHNEPRNVNYSLFTPPHSIQASASNRKHRTNIRSVTAMGMPPHRRPNHLAL